MIRDETEILENDRDLVAAYGERPADRQYTLAEAPNTLNDNSRTAVKSSPNTGSERTSPEGLSESFTAATGITAEKLGDAARTFTANTQSGNYRGEIIGETDLHVVQRLSPNSAVAHMKHLLQSTPRVGDNVRVAYANELGSVKESRERSRVQEVAR